MVLMKIEKIRIKKPMDLSIIKLENIHKKLEQVFLTIVEKYDFYALKSRVIKKKSLFTRRLMSSKYC
jgi:hypothetical protein